MSRPPKYSPSEFISICSDIYGDRFDFSISKYVNNRIPIEYMCNNCGEISQNNPYNLLQNKFTFDTGCKKCNLMPRQLTTVEFIRIATKIHGDRYDYSLTNYINARIKVEITCNICNSTFKQRTTAHLYNESGCPKCRKSHGERIISLELDNMGIKYHEQYKFMNCIGVGGKPLIFDFYIPDMNICIEYDGKQHTDKKSKFWSETIPKNDNLKDLYCINNHLKMIRIPYTDKLLIPSIISEIFAIAPAPISPQNSCLYTGGITTNSLLDIISE